MHIHSYMHCLTPLSFLLLAGPVMAQTVPAVSAVAPTPTEAQTAPIPTARTAADTVQAIHRIFKKHRRLGNALTMGAVAADLTLAGISAAQEEKQSSGGGGGYGWNPGGLRFGIGGYAVIYAIFAAPVAGVGIQQLIAYGPRRETKIVDAFEANHRLPAKIRRQLRKHLK